eukprot:TRINITY_DN4622_c0_g1_i1.p1 TRINITY_DN4622_c0_g1~~TRINITY_DN4622_c0_g1_i1.p1  ORF type:complete len:213 (-),score=57.69 TRINITY_DN4622_c0_g1_i1:69-707(-)
MTDQSVPEGALDALDRLETALSTVAVHCQPYLSNTSAGLTSHLLPEEHAVVNLVAAQALNAVFCAFLASRGIAAADDPLQQQEVERVQLYAEKVSRLAVSRRGLPASRPKVNLDVQAAGRFIEHAIPDLSQDQREEIRETTAAAPAKKRQRQRKEDKKLTNRGDQGGLELEGRRRPKQRNLADEAAAFLIATKADLQREKDEEEQKLRLTDR